MSAGFAQEVGQSFGVDGPVEKTEAGGAEEAVALGVDLSHQNVVTAWTRKIHCQKLSNTGVM